MSFSSILLFSLLSFITGAAAPGDSPQANLLFAGDAMQHQAQLDRAKELAGGKGYDYSGCFTYIAPTVTQADYAVCNLEVPLGGGPDYTGFPCFSAPDSYAVALKDAGFDMLLTANNHCLDRRDKAARRTITVLDSLGIDHTGTFHDDADRTASLPLIREINGFKIGFLNYTYGTNGIEPQDNVEVSLIDRDAMAREIKLTRDAGAELIVVAIHWGIEYVLLENESQRSTADFLLNQGVDMVIGGHPHVIQPMKMVKNPVTGKNSVVVYSLGNFISNMKTGDTRGGALINVTVKRDKDGNAYVDKAGYDTFFSAKPEGAGSNFMVVPSWMEDKIPASQRGHWTIFNNSASKIFNAHNEGIERIHQ